MSKPTRKETILKEAASLFKQKGYSATSMRELAEKVGVEAASLYNHIQNKEAILEDICFTIAKQYIAHIEEIENQCICAIDKLKSLISIHVRMSIASPDEVSVANHDWKNLSDSKKELYKSLRQGYEKRVGQLIEEGVSKNEFRCVNTSVALYTFLSSLRWIELWYRNDRDISPETIENDIITILTGGFKKTTNAS